MQPDKLTVKSREALLAAQNYATLKNHQAKTMVIYFH